MTVMLHCGVFELLACELELGSTLYMIWHD